MAHPNLQDDVEALLKLAESSTEKVKFEDTEVEKFINECSIISGDTKVATYIVYYKYYKWKVNKRKLKARCPFFKQFKKHFENVQTDDGRGYLLNPEPFDISQEGYFKARALLRRERDGRKKEKSK